MLYNQFTIQKTLGLFNVKFVFCLILYLCKCAVVTFNREGFLSSTSCVSCCLQVGKRSCTSSAF